MNNKHWPIWLMNVVSSRKAKGFVVKARVVGSVIYTPPTATHYHQNLYPPLLPPPTVIHNHRNPATEKAPNLALIHRPAIESSDSTQVPLIHHQKYPQKSKSKHIKSTMKPIPKPMTYNGPWQAKPTTTHSYPWPQEPKTTHGLMTPHRSKATQSEAYPSKADLERKRGFTMRGREERERERGVWSERKRDSV